MFFGEKKTELVIFEGAQESKPQLIALYSNMKLTNFGPFALYHHTPILASSCTVGSTGIDIWSTRSRKHEWTPTNSLE